MPILRDATLCIQEAARCNERRPILEKQRAVNAHDLRIVHSVFGGTGKVDLSLYNDTFFTQVECFFVTEEEHHKLKEVSLGDKVLISGCVTLLNGQPS